MGDFPWFDLLFLIIILYTLFMGFLKGFVKEIISITFFIGGLVFAFREWTKVSSLLRPVLKVSFVCDFLSFVLILMGFMALGAFIAFLIKKIFIRGPLKFLDRMAGLVFGGIKGIAIGLIIIILIIAYLPGIKLPEKSVIAFYSLEITDSLAKIFPPEIYEKYCENINKFKAGGGNGKRI